MDIARVRIDRWMVPLNSNTVPCAMEKLNTHAFVWAHSLYLWLSIVICSFVQYYALVKVANSVILNAVAIIYAVYAPEWHTCINVTNGTKPT